VRGAVLAAHRLRRDFNACVTRVWIRCISIRVIVKKRSSRDVFSLTTNSVNEQV